MTEGEIILTFYILNIIFCWRVGKWLDNIEAYPNNSTKVYLISSFIPFVNVIVFIGAICELIKFRDKLKFSPIEFLSTEAKEEISLAKFMRKTAREEADKKFSKELSRIKKADKKNKILNTLDLTDEDIEYLKSRRTK